MFGKEEECKKIENKNTSLLFSTKLLNCSALPHSSGNPTECVDIREVSRTITLLANLQCPMLVECIWPKDVTGSPLDKRTCTVFNRK